MTGIGMLPSWALAGLAGLFLPALPGAALLFGRLALAAWIGGFAYVGRGTSTGPGAPVVLTIRPISRRACTIPGIRAITRLAG